MFTPELKNSLPIQNNHYMLNSNFR